MLWLAILAADIDVGTIFGWIVAGIGVVGFLAATAQFLRGSADRGTIISLKSSVDALQVENELKDEKIEQLVTLSERQTSELEVWRNAVTAKQELLHLQQSVHEHHIESMKAVHDMKENQRQILTNQDALISRILESEKRVVENAIEVKRLVARMHGELAEIRNVVKP